MLVTKLTIPPCQCCPFKPPCFDKPCRRVLSEVKGSKLWVFLYPPPPPSLLLFLLSAIPPYPTLPFNCYWRPPKGRRLVQLHWWTPMCPAMFSNCFPNLSKCFSNVFKCFHTCPDAFLMFSKISNLFLKCFQFIPTNVFLNVSTCFVSKTKTYQMFQNVFIRVQMLS